MKLNNTKPKLSLLYRTFLFEVAKARMYGLTKYPDAENWRTTDPSDHFSAALRHIYAHLDGEELDSESGVSHLGHAGANIMFEIERLYGEKPGTTVFASGFTCKECGKNLVARENDICNFCLEKGIQS